MLKITKKYTQEVPPYLGNARKETFFSGRCSLRTFRGVLGKKKQWTCKVCQQSLTSRSREFPVLGILQERDYGCFGRRSRSKAKCLLLQVRWSAFLVSPRYHSYQEWVGWGELHRWLWQELFTSCSAPNKWSLSTTESHCCIFTQPKAGQLAHLNTTIFITLFTHRSLPTSQDALVFIWTGCPLPALHQGHHRELHC